MITGDIFHDYEMADNDEFIEYYSNEGLESMLCQLDKLNAKEGK